VPKPAPDAVPAMPHHVVVPGERITLRDLAAKTKDGCPTNTLRTYGTYIDLLVKGWPAEAPKEEKLFAGLGDMWADEVLPSELEKALAFVKQRALLGGYWRDQRREAADRATRNSDAHGAMYNAVGAWRRMFKIAVKDRHLAKGFDPAQELDKPKRNSGTRQALEQAQYDQLWLLVDNTGDDPLLDRMICETIVISGARQEGILNLALGGIDLEECTIRLDEKFDKVIHQPVPDWFARRLYDFARSRGAVRPGDKVFRKRAVGSRPAKPIGPRRFNYLFERLQAAYSWADKEQVCGHTLRHTPSP
jgi:site-specific recombinase XerC